MTAASGTIGVLPMLAVTVPFTPRKAAVTVGEPVLTPVRYPCEPAAFDTVADPVEDSHVAKLVRSAVEESA